MKIPTKMSFLNDPNKYKNKKYGKNINSFNYLLMLYTLSQLGTLLLYPVARIIESNSFSWPSMNLAPVLVISLTPSTTCIYHYSPCTKTCA